MDTATRPFAPSNLPLALTSFVGREQERADIAHLLRTTRLLTLTGAGGVGKTRLALEVASRLRDDYAHGIWLVELAALTEPGLVPQTVAGVLGVREVAGHSLLTTLLAALAPRRLLLVLDNCEHVIDACAHLAAALLHGCAQLTILATSREALGIGGETAWRVPSLPVPDTRHVPPLEQLAHVEAVRLFTERAQAAQPRFTLTQRNAAAVAEVCQQLDGIPLALELAAARVAVLPVEQLATRLGDRFRLLTSGNRTALPRQQTLRATIDWSYDLLSKPERLLLCRLAVFAGGFTIEAAEAVCAGDGIEQGEILDLLLRLLVKSLVQVDEGVGGEARYQLLETVRQYAGERLAEAGETEAVRGRHTAYFLALAEAAEPALRAAEQVAWLARLDVDHDNLRAALGWCQEADPEAGLRLAASIGVFWRLRHHHTEGRRWLASLLARTPNRPALRATALIRAAVLAREQGELRTAHAHLEDALALSRAVDAPRLTVWSLHQLGQLLLARGDHRAARAPLEEALALVRITGDHAGLGANLFMLGDVAQRDGDYQGARRLLEESLAVLRAVGDPWLLTVALWLLAGVTLGEGKAEQAAGLVEEALALGQEVGAPLMTALLRWQLGRVVHWQGDLTRAIALYKESLALARDLEDRLVVARPLVGLGRLLQHQGDATQALLLLQESLALCTEAGDSGGRGEALQALGLVAWSQGDPATAMARLRESLALRRALGERLGMVTCLEALAMVAVGTGHAERAARLLGAAEAFRQAVGAPLSPVERPGYAALVDTMRTDLGEAGFAVAWAVGRTRTVEQAADEALTGTDRGGPGCGEAAGRSPAHDAGPLTAREQQVARLVAQGLSNPQIGTALAISERTAERHVSNILNKLGFTSRAQVAAWVGAHGWLAASPE